MRVELEDALRTRLERAAHELGKRPEDVATTLLDEALRRREFPAIEIRETPAGRTAYLAATRVAVWQAVKLVRSFGDEARVAAHLELPEPLIHAGMAYAGAFGVAPHP